MCSDFSKKNIPTDCRYANSDAMVLILLHKFFTEGINFTYITFGGHVNLFFDERVLVRLAGVRLYQVFKNGKNA